MKCSVALVALLVPATAAAQTESGPFARVAVFQPAPGRSADFEAGYRRHLEWHRGARDPWVWYGWTVGFGERLDRLFDATFGHSAAALDSAVAPAADGADNARNVTPYGEFISNAVYRFLPALSTGGPAPAPSRLLEWTVVDVVPGAERGFEDALAGAGRSGETLWYRRVAGGATPAYLRLRPMAGYRDLSAQGADLPPTATALVRSVRTELLAFRPDLSLGVDLR